MPEARSSLQGRLFGWLMLPVVLALPLLGLALYSQVQSSAQSWLDEALEDIALTLAGQLDTRGATPRLEVSATLDRALRFDRQDDVFYLVLGPDGQVLQGDAGLAELRPRLPAPTVGVSRHAQLHQAQRAVAPARCWWPRR
jgi:two-component system, OmpR family, sensor histidine kinase TctE